jgi:hypothetical protein
MSARRLDDFTLFGQPERARASRENGVGFRIKILMRKNLEALILVKFFSGVFFGVS